MAVLNPSETPVLTYTVDVTIASGAALSGTTDDLNGLSPVALIVPASMAGTVLTFQVACDEAVATFSNLYYDNFGTNTELSIALTTAAQAISLHPYIPHFFGAKAIKVRAGTSASTSAQAGAKAVTVVCRYLK